jgi:molybdate transport system substrate-binding protein
MKITPQTRFGLIGQALLTGFLAIGLNVETRADELMVSAGGPARAIFEKWAEEYMAANNVRIKFAFGTVAKVQASVAADEHVDLVFLSSEAMQDLERNGKIRQGSRVKVGRVGLGIASKAGGVKPDIATPDALRKALLAAPVIAYPSAKTVTGRLVDDVLRQIGIADVIGPKVRRFPGASAVVKFVAEGQGDELAVAPMTTIAAARTGGVQLVGAVPASLQHYAGYELGISSNSRSAEAARSALQSLTSSVGQSHFLAGGFEIER